MWGSIASTGSMTTNHQNVTVLMTRKAIYFWAPTQQREQGKWPLFEPVLETEMEETFPVRCAILLPILPLAHYPICPSSHAQSVVFGLLES
jgi:hypothetical protein